jgi:peptidyl-tRNA hydrolase, PTH2 family
VRARPGPMEYKLVIVVREDLGLSPGKMAVQVAHAAVTAALEAKARHTKWFHAWFEEGQKKVVVRAADLDALKALERKAAELKLPTALVEDAGLTELPPGTTTCLGIGPGPNHLIDAVTGHLKLA